jgi:hypothetical protein
MPLTYRGNGTAPQYQVGASWWNDYYNLLTGVMVDQPITIKNNTNIQASYGTPPACVATPQAGSGLGVGTYTYAVTFVWADEVGQTVLGNYTAATTTTGSQEVALSAIPTGPTGTHSRQLWRTVVNGATFYLLGTISDNVTTTWTDTLPDSTLTTQGAWASAFPYGHPSFGGMLSIFGANGTRRGVIFADGAVRFDNGNIHSDGNGNFYCNQVNATSFVSAADISTDGGKITSNGGGDLTVGNLITTGTNGLTLTGGNVTFGASYGSITFYNGATIYGPGTFGGITVECANASGAALAVGLKPSSGPIIKVFEVSCAGQVTTIGTTYKSSTSTIPTLGNNATFDSFDLSETYPCEEDYAPGTVVCPGPHDQLVRCTHDNCHAALVITNEKAAFIVGQVDHEKAYLPVALVGRIHSYTTSPVALRDFVVSNGKGGVRTASPGEHANVLGIALSTVDKGAVGLMLRPMHVFVEKN